MRRQILVALSLAFFALSLAWVQGQPSFTDPFQTVSRVYTVSPYGNVNVLTGAFRTIYQAYTVSPYGNVNVLTGTFKTVPFPYVFGAMGNESFGFLLLNCSIVIDASSYAPTDPWLCFGSERLVIEVPPYIDNASIEIPSNATPPFTLWIGINGSVGEVPFGEWAVYNVSGSLYLFVNVGALDLSSPAFLYLCMKDPSGIYPQLASSLPSAPSLPLLCGAVQTSPTPAPSPSLTTTTVGAVPSPAYSLPGFSLTIALPTPPPVTVFRPSLPSMTTALGLLYLAMFLALFVGLSRLIPWYTALAIAGLVLCCAALIMWSDYSGYAMAAGVVAIIIGLALTKSRGA